MDFRQLRYFVQIVESGSLSKASRALFVAQPALSQQLAKLEDEVGKPLLHRTSRGVVTTESGLALYHHARFLLRQLAQALSIARGERGELRVVVSIGLPATTLLAIGLPLVRHVRSQYPGILLNVVEGMSGHLSQMIQLGQLDLAILFSGDVGSDLDATPLLDEELFVILPERSKLVRPGRSSIAIAEAAALPLILPTSRHGLRRRIEAEFEKKGLSAQVVAEIDSLSLLMRCVNEGIGATIKPLSALQLDCAHSSAWRALAVSDATLCRRNYLYSIRPEMLSPAAAAIAGEIRQIAELLIVTGEWKGVSLIDRSVALADAGLDPRSVLERA